MTVGIATAFNTVRINVSVFHLRLLKKYFETSLTVRLYAMLLILCWELNIISMKISESRMFRWLRNVIYEQELNSLVSSRLIASFVKS